MRAMGHTPCTFSETRACRLDTDLAGKARRVPWHVAHPALAPFSLRPKLPSTSICTLLSSAACVMTWPASRSKHAVNEQADKRKTSPLSVLCLWVVGGQVSAQRSESPTGADRAGGSRDLHPVDVQLHGDACVAVYARAGETATSPV